MTGGLCGPGTTLALVGLLTSVSCLEMVGLAGPAWVRPGESLQLVCKYDLGGDSIYSLKWFKVRAEPPRYIIQLRLQDNAEIWRFLPGEHQSHNTRAFPLPDLHLHNTSRPHLLHATVAGPTAAGLYRCDCTGAQVYRAGAQVRGVCGEVFPDTLSCQEHHCRR